MLLLWLEALTKYDLISSSLLPAWNTVLTSAFIDEKYIVFLRIFTVMNFINGYKFTSSCSCTEFLYPNYIAFIILYVYLDKCRKAESNFVNNMQKTCGHFVEWTLGVCRAWYISVCEGPVQRGMWGGEQPEHRAGGRGRSVVNGWSMVQSGGRAQWWCCAWGLYGTVRRTPQSTGPRAVAPIRPPTRDSSASLYRGAPKPYKNK